MTLQSIGRRCVGILVSFKAERQNLTVMENTEPLPKTR